MERLNLSFAEKETVRWRYDFHCAYCGKSFGYENRSELMIDHIQRKAEINGRIHPDNLLPACPTCLKAKDTMTVDGFRASISGLLNQLRHRNTYALAKAYGLVAERDINVEFYFEKVEK